MYSMSDDFMRGVLGVVAPISGVTISRIQDIELWLRIASLTVGILVGLMTAFSLALSIRRKLKNQDDE